jgi:hypothetical protein
MTIMIHGKHLSLLGVNVGDIFLTYGSCNNVTTRCTQILIQIHWQKPSESHKLNVVVYLEKL